MNRNFSELIELARDYEQQPPELQLPDGHPGEQSVAGWIDHTLLKPEATPDQVTSLCEEARRYRFATVCINPVHVPLSRRLLEGSGVLTCTVVGFPLGATLTELKGEETRSSIHAGAQEIDMVLQIGLLKAGEYAAVAEDIQRVVEVAHPYGARVKVILETALLTRYEKIVGCLLCRMENADFVKTSTGFSAGGATVDDVALMRRVVGLQTGVKAAGGIRSLADAHAMLNAGATRLGTSAGAKLVQEERQTQ